MSEADQSVFISYRRSVSSFIARAVFQDLRANGFDVFMDVESLDSGAFSQVLLNQIAARTHFVLILTPGTLDGCGIPGDWVRREIETAMELERNIVPLLINDFKFEEAEPYLTGALGDLKSYNGLAVPHDYFDAAMERLRTRFLKQTMRGEIMPVSPREQTVADHKIELAAQQPAPTESEYTAQQYYAHALKHFYAGNFEDVIGDLNEAIRLQPDYAAAYIARGSARAALQQYEQAVTDYSNGLKFDDSLVQGYEKRGGAYLELDQFEKALADYSAALKRFPMYTDAYYGRGQVYAKMADFKKALADFDKAIELDPKFTEAYDGRASAHYHRGEYEKTIEDYTHAFGTGQQTYWRHNNRAEAYFALGRYQEAFQDYKAGLKLQPGNRYAEAGLAITYYALGSVKEACGIWKDLIEDNPRYRDVIWVAHELTWAPPLAEAARKLLAACS